MRKEQQILDCRGLACPAPVLKVKELLDAARVERLTVLVDNEAAGENVKRFLEHSGYQAVVAPEKNGLAVSGSRQEAAGACELAPNISPEAEAQKVMVLVATDRLGRGDDHLGRKLLLNFLATLKEMGKDLWRLVLVNAGVKLAIAGSEALASLEELSDNGVDILVCGTCLNHFGLLESKQVGETTNMLDIVTSMQLADRVISLT